ALFIEVGAGRGLLGLLKEHANNERRPNGVNIIRHQNEKENDAKYFTERLGQLWAHGVEIDWQSFAAGGMYHRVSYPTYSFEPSIFPAEVNPPAEKAGSGANSAAGQGSLKDWIYYPVWKSSFLPSPAATTGRKCFLYFSTGDPFSDSLRKQLIKDDDVLIEVFMGDQFTIKNRHAFVLDPMRSAHYNALAGELKNSGVPVTDIVYSWCIGADATRMELKADNREIHLAYFSLAEIVRMLFRNTIPVKNGITILTDSLHKVSGYEEGSCVQSLVLGLLNVIPQEYPIPCRSIDIVIAGHPGETAGALSGEIRNENFRDRIVAIRNGRRWIQDYQKDPSAFVMPEENKKIKNGGVYLITGGLGNVGFLLAKHLVSRYNAKVVLTGRRDISGYPESNEGTRRLKALEGLTRDVRYRKVDIGNREELTALSRSIENDLGRINGIIHTAGNTDRDCFELIEDLTPQHSIAVFLPKVLGVRNLYEVFGDYNADFVWITSSIASIVGGLKFSSYSSANAFMESFVSMKGKELPNWKCIGLAEILPTEIETREKEAAKRQFLTPDELISLFELSLHKDLPVIFETIQDLPSRFEEIFAGDKGTDNPVAGEKIGKAERPKLSNSFVPPNSNTEKTVVQLMENFFGIAGLGVTDNFFDLGGDSLMAMSFLTKVKNVFTVNITIKFFFDNPTANVISSKINEIKSLTEVKKHTSKKII
ncbi:MAG TPA: SDR family NAD(P)-dependent oxidoreductase, partial [Puia sp.]|nr:SDR family NAD(P)-dependent oxidoreductase [Puia sp.]